MAVVHARVEERHERSVVLSLMRGAIRQILNPAGLFFWTQVGQEERRGRRHRAYLSHQIQQLQGILEHRPVALGRHHDPSWEGDEARIDLDSKTPRQVREPVPDGAGRQRRLSQPYLAPGRLVGGHSRRVCPELGKRCATDIVDGVDQIGIGWLVGVAIILRLVVPDAAGKRRQLSVRDEKRDRIRSTAFDHRKQLHTIFLPFEGFIIDRIFRNNVDGNRQATLLREFEFRSLRIQVLLVDF